jgi:hypothetical protein
MLSSDWLIKGVFLINSEFFHAFSPSQGYLSLGIPYDVANTMVIGNYPAQGKIPCLNSL